MAQFGNDHETGAGRKRDIPCNLEAIHTKYETDSDQFYFANIWGAQEYARIARKPELLEHRKDIRQPEEQSLPKSNLTRTEPEPSEKQTEYHIGIDYESSAFQTLAFYKQFLTFMRPADAWTQFQHQTPIGVAGPARPAYDLTLPADIHESQAPFQALKLANPDAVERWPSWSDVELLYNTVTGVIPVLIHFTGEKKFRAVWWQKMVSSADIAQCGNPLRTGGPNFLPWPMMC